MTDRVELTDDEAKVLTKAAKLLREAKRYWQDQPNAAAARSQANRLFAGVVAARVQEYAEKFESLSDRAKTAATELGAKNDRLAAELAAANAELEAALPKRTNDWLAHCKRLDAERDAVSDDLCKAWKELGEVEAENAALQATLDRVGAFIETWSQPHSCAKNNTAQCVPCRMLRDLRAALTPEGKP